MTCKEIDNFYKKLKDGRCKNCKFGKVVSAGNWSFLVCYAEPYKGKWVAEIRVCPIGRRNEKEYYENE